MLFVPGTAARVRPPLVAQRARRWRGCNLCGAARARARAQVRGLAKKMGRQLDTPNELWGFFVERTRANLHLVREGARWLLLLVPASAGATGKQQPGPWLSTLRPPLINRAAP